jgi:pyruvate dehydrogenase E2 component (dihydrolipoamide acetyltransferase)
LGVDVGAVRGTGRGGRVRERDVLAVAAAMEGKLIPLSPIRRTIAQRMVAAVTQAAPVTLTTEVDATNLVALRSRLRAAADGGTPSLTDVILVLTARALQQHPGMQAQWREDGLFVPSRIHVALAVDTEAGLLAPVLRDVDRLSLQEVASQARELAALARAGRLTAETMRGATFTVTNLGTHGIDAFTPLLHLPQSAVLGIGRICRKPAVVNDQIVPRDRLTLSLTFDHRIIDGAPAARFLDTVRKQIEDAS